MSLSANKTKIVCTIGPASESPEVMLQMMQAGMNIARLNFSHGEFDWHKAAIDHLRSVAHLVGKRLTILADLPGPKMRVEQLAQEPIVLKRGDSFILTVDELVGNTQRVSVSFKRLPVVVAPGDLLYINDGVIQLQVSRVLGGDVECRVLTGGELRSRKGLNLPSINLGISAFTERDRECLKFALENGVDAVSQSFVETAADVDAVRQAAAEWGYQPFIVAKIERASALTHIEEILKAADGIMVARGDLGVETPIERIAVVQKQLIRQARLLGKPVITATQMLESMVEHGRPTRAEVTDVANAILDGTDCVMLSEESAMGKFPVESVSMLAAIAVATEPYQAETPVQKPLAAEEPDGDVHMMDLIAINIQQTVAQLAPIAVVIPTLTGHTARMVSRFKLPIWIAAICPDEFRCHGLQFSYGVSPVLMPERPLDWNIFVNRWAQSEGLGDGVVALTEGPSPHHALPNPRLEIIQVRHGE
jgi:pyruvate kinase